MSIDRNRTVGSAVVAALAVAALIAGCGGKEPPPSAPAAAPGTPAPAEQAAAPSPSVEAAPSSVPLASTEQTWTPEAMEALLAPVALYPDPVLSQVLMASTNPQEVLDAGNWLIANPDLKDKALDQATEQAGFTPPMRALMQFRQVVDQMCLEMGWTAELGQAFTNDQAGVLSAVQRLRTQAMDAGNLQSSEQMKVEKQVENGQEAIVISPPTPQVVYVPTYDPVAAYAPAPAAAAPAPAAAPATAEADKGHSTGSMIATGVLAFGAGLLVAEIFDDDDDDYYHGSYYYPNYHHGYMPPPPPYYYRPAYGNGYRPGYGYNRPPSYNNVLSNNNVVVVNRDKNSNYWNSFDDRPTGKQRAKSVQSPITTAKSSRPELTRLNEEARAPKQRAGQTASGASGQRDWKGQSGYAGARPETRQKANLPPASKATASKAASNASTAKSRVSASAGDRGYAGAAKAKPATAKRPEAAAKAPSPARPAAKAPSPARPAATNRPGSSSAERPASGAKRDATPSRQAAAGGGARRETAASGSARGSADRAASQRGRSSMPQGAKGKSKGKDKGGAAQKKKRS